MRAINKILHSFAALFTWLIALFDPPPLASLSLFQKTGRVFLLSFTLVIASILFAMLGAVGLYLMERGRELDSMPEFWQGVWIILVGVGVNAGCIFVLIQLKKVDNKLLPPPEK